MPNHQPSPRRVEIDAKQGLVASVLQEVGAEHLILVEPPNLAWFTGAPLAGGIFDPTEQPALVLSSQQRWLVCSSVDTQRLFDRHLDNLGFQLKEWPWHQGREQLLADLSQNRTTAWDRLPSGIPHFQGGDKSAPPLTPPLRGGETSQKGGEPNLPLLSKGGLGGVSIAVGDRLKFRRRTLTPPEQARLLELGKLLSHALEATGRNLTLGASEEEVAGQLSHRLVHHGVEPVSLTVVADGRNRADRRPGFTPAKVNLHCTISAFARLHGLHAVSARTICFGSMDDELRQEFDAASRVLAQRVSVSVAGATVQEVFDLGQVVAVEAGFPHEWRQCSAGFITGWLPVEQTLTPTTTDRLQIGWPLVLQVSIGTALCVETYVVTDQNPRYITVPEFWPVKHVRIQGQSIVVPDVLVRDG